MRVVRLKEVYRNAAGLKCMYRCVVFKSACPASSWIARAGAPRIARCEQNVMPQDVYPEMVDSRGPRGMRRVVADGLLRSPVALRVEEHWGAAQIA